VNASSVPPGKIEGVGGLEPRTGTREEGDAHGGDEGGKEKKDSRESSPQNYS
jgi:hypothetical protein